MGVRGKEGVRGREIGERNREVGVRGWEMGNPYSLVHPLFYGDNLHEMSKSIFREKEEKYH